jgi:exosome complex RNA-binding protein Csl4
MTMTLVRRARANAAAALMLITLGACSSTGGLGSILGGVLGGQGNQVFGYVQGVDTRNRQIAVQQSNGQTLWVAYDNNTQVAYNNQNYPVTALQNGDQVTANVQDNGNGAYYTNYIQVNQSVRGGGSVNGSVRSLQGNVAQVDRANGWFAVDASNYGRVQVVLPPQMSRADLDRFNNLRSGDYVRFYALPVGGARVQLQQFY